MEFTFPYDTHVERLQLGAESLDIECLTNLDTTIDAFFAEYERTGRAELFEGLCPYFGVPWQAGKALALVMLEERARWKGKEVLELGCGLAIPSLVLARAGAAVTATDQHPDVPVFLEKNRERNRIAGPEYLFLDWRTSRSLPPAELVIGSDIVYDRAQPTQLYEFLRGFYPWREAAFTDPGRPYWETFVALAKREGWNAREELREGVFLLRLSR